MRFGDYLGWPERDILSSRTPAGMLFDLAEALPEAVTRLAPGESITIERTEDPMVPIRISFSYKT